MRVFGKFSFGFCLLAAFIVLIYFFYSVKKEAFFGKRRTVEKFLFSSEMEMKKWKEKVLSQRGTEYSLEREDGLTFIKAVSEDSASALFYKIRLSRVQNPFVSWKWRIEEFPLTEKEKNLTKKSQFDFAAQVYVIFYARFLPKARAIQYVWVKDGEKGTIARNPYTKNVRTVVLESGEAGVWRQEKRDINEDYRMLFGEDLRTDIMAVSFMTDSDSTSSRAVAGYTDITIGYLGKKGKEELSDI